MATISQIKIGNQTYDIHDAVMGNRFNNGVLQRAYGGTGQTTADALDGEFSQNFVTNTNDSGNTYFRAVRTDTGHEVNFGIGAGGDNRGIWDLSLDDWMIRADSNNRVCIKDWGTVKTVNKGSTSNWTVGNHTIGTISLNNEPGIWILLAWAYFDDVGTSNSTNKNDRRVIDITTSSETSAGNLSCVTAAAISGKMGLSTTRFVQHSLSNPPTSGANYNLVIYHNSNSAIGVRGRMDAVRVAMA